MAEVTLEAHIQATGEMSIGKTARRLAIQESIIDHMIKTLMDHGGPIDQETAEIMARRAYFLHVGFLQAAKDFGILR